MVTRKLSGKPDEMLGRYMRWISIPSRRSSNTPSRFMLQKPGTAPAAMRARLVTEPSREAGLFQILKHRFHLKIAFAQN